eukprot:TCONS_00071354-protein
MPVRYPAHPERLSHKRFAVVSEKKGKRHRQHKRHRNDDVYIVDTGHHRSLGREKMLVEQAPVLIESPRRRHRHRNDDVYTVDTVHHGSSGREKMLVEHAPVLIESPRRRHRRRKHRDIVYVVEDNRKSSRRDFVREGKARHVIGGNINSHHEPNDFRRRRHPIGGEEFYVIDDGLEEVLVDYADYSNDMIEIVDDRGYNGADIVYEDEVILDQEGHRFSDHADYKRSVDNWNLPALPSSSKTSNHYNSQSEHHQSFDSSNHGHGISSGHTINEEESRIVSVIEQPPIPRDYHKWKVIGDVPKAIIRMKQHSEHSSQNGFDSSNHMSMRESEEGVMNVISQPPVKKDYERWKVIGDVPQIVTENAVQSGGKTKKISFNESAHNAMNGHSESYNTKSYHDESVNNGTRVETTEKIYSASSNTTGKADKLVHDIPEYAVINKKGKVKKSELYDKIDFTKKPSPELRVKNSQDYQSIHEVQKQTNSAITESSNDDHSRLPQHQSSHQAMVHDIKNGASNDLDDFMETIKTTTKTTTRTMYKMPIEESPHHEYDDNHTGHHDWEDRIMRKVSTPSAQAHVGGVALNSHSVESDLKTWMDEQRSNRRKSGNITPIPTQSVLVDGDMTPPLRRQRVDTAIIEPEVNVGTGQQDYFAEDFTKDEVDGNAKILQNDGQKRKRRSLLDRLRGKSTSPRENDYEEEEKEDDEDSWYPGKHLKEWYPGKFKDKIKDCIEQYLAENPSPWGRLKRCGNPETCQEVKDRIKERTIFMTPTSANQMHTKSTELNLDKMEQIDDGENISFISRCVENDPNANTDDEEETMNNKSGMYIKFFCEDHQEWEDKCCKSN